MPSSGNSAAKRRLPLHLERAVDARDRRADHGRACDGSAGRARRPASSCRAPARWPSSSRSARRSARPAWRCRRCSCVRLPPGSPSTATIVRLASSILKPLSRSGAASASSASAAARKLCCRRRLAAQRRLRLPGPPRLVRDAAEREAHVPDRAVLDLERRRHRDQREGVARPVAHLAIGRAAPRTAAPAARPR